MILSAAGILFLPLCSLSAERCITHLGYTQKSIRKGEEDVEQSRNDATSVTLSHVCLGFSCKLHPNAKQLQVSRPKTRTVIPLSL